MNRGLRRARLRKLETLRSGRAPRVLDLFSGCGGLSLGFQAAGFEIVAGVECDRDAAASHAMNFGRGEGRGGAGPADITATTPADLAALLDLGDPSCAFDVIVGGPPCQAYSRVGRAKLREVAGAENAHLIDPRAVLHEHFVRYVIAFSPLAVVMENVPDAVCHGGTNIPELVCQALEAHGYQCAYTFLNAVHYGVPQYRERVFLIALADEVEQEPGFPAPSHRAEVPQNYRVNLEHAMRFHRGQGDLFGARGHFAVPPAPRPTALPAVTVGEAIGDLPALFLGDLARLGEGDGRSASRVGGEAPSPYAQLMRSWPGFEAPAELVDHDTRRLPRDHPIFARMKPGMDYHDALRIARELLRERVEQARAETGGAEPGPAELAELERRIVPPYDPSKFRDKWRVLDPEQPAHTLPAHLGKDSYSHIHYDAAQARTITVREAARLQSFPDGFVFAGGLNARFAQIGNAVPPLLARAIAVEVHARLRGTVRGAPTR